MTKHAALYIRVSTDAQFEEGYSIEAQKDMLEGYCASRSITKFEYYIDGGFTGSNIERPQMQRMIDDVIAGKISTVVVYKLDRLSRSQKDTLYLIEDVFNPNSAGFVSVNENMDTSTPIGRAMLGIMSAFAQLERETIRERTRMGMRERVKKGFWPGGGKTPFGYDYDSVQGILVPNCDSETVKRAYQLYLQGYSAEKIASLLGLCYDRLVTQILTRKTNLGLICYNGEEYQGQHAPIISPEIFEETAQIMQRRARQKTASGTHLLTGILQCGECGAKMRYQKWGNAGQKLVCYSQQKSKPYLVHDANCKNPRVWAEDVEHAVLQDVFKFAAKIKSLRATQHAESAQHMLQKQIAKSGERLKRLYSLYAADENDLLLDTINDERGKIQKLEQQIKNEIKSGMETKKREKLTSKITDLQSAWEFLEPKEKQEILRAIICKIVITGDKLEIDYVLE